MGREGLQAHIAFLLRAKTHRLRFAQNPSCCSRAGRSAIRRRHPSAAPPSPSSRVVAGQSGVLPSRPPLISSPLSSGLSFFLGLGLTRSPDCLLSVAF